MKNYRALVPIVMILLMVVSWYMLISEAMETEEEYNLNITEARKYAEKGITKYAIDYYTKALEIKDSTDIYVEVAEYYKKQGKQEEYLSWCIDFFDKYPKEPKAYDCLLQSYMECKDYESCYDILTTATKRNVSSDYIKEVTEKIKYVYTFDFNTYEDVSVYSNNFCAVCNKGVWGFVDRYGKVRIACKYVDVGAFTKTNYASVVNADGEAYFIDKTGSKILVATDTYKNFGLLVGGIIPAQKIDGKYVYVNQDLKELFGEYDYASTINNDIAAVLNGNKWSLIKANGDKVTEETYVDVKLDEKNIAYRNDRLFVSKNGSCYIMIDGKGKQIGSLTFEDAKVFASTDSAAVKIDGKWRFISKDGKLVSDKKYDDARSYINDLAAVCIDGKWGFVDRNENIVIDAQFNGTKDFNEKGSCFVNTGDKWQLLKLYRLNREN